jgi:hypothetical protein
MMTIPVYATKLKLRVSAMIEDNSVHSDFIIFANEVALYLLGCV